MLPSEYPEIGDRPALRELLRIQVDMHVADLKTLLCLPRDIDGLRAGCNLTAGTLALNIIAGASVLFWQASMEGIADRRRRGARFTSMLRTKYPWNAHDAVDAENGARLLWDYTRNPLSHTLGIGKNAQLFPGFPSNERGIWLAKFEDGLAAQTVDELMSGRDRPEGLGGTITDEFGGYVVNVVALAWGVHRMLRDLFADVEHADAAETTARALLGRD